MLCPADQTPLTMSERQGIEIDYCPTCRGVWLDRGELDKIIERSEAQSAPAAAPAQPAPPPQQQYQQPQYQQPQYGAPPHGYHKPYHKRRKSFLEELFD
jgi:Zn-finger nucleic acid-binding protein